MKHRHKEKWPFQGREPPVKSGSGGFTLVEMLVVVAVIAILTAVSIPMVTGSMDRVRCAADAANERAAKAAASIKYLTGDVEGNVGDKSYACYVYDTRTGTLGPATGTGMGNIPDSRQCQRHRSSEQADKGQKLFVRVDTKTGKIDLLWRNQADWNSAQHGSYPWNQDLCSHHLN